LEKRRAGFRAQESSRKRGRKEMVAGVGFEPTTSGL